jgi:transcriptional regulator with XRE-family HTH domain
MVINRTQFALPALRAIRLHRGLSQGRLAVLVGMTQSDVSNIETGRRPVGALRRMRLSLALAMHESLLFAKPVAVDAEPREVER